MKEEIELLKSRLKKEKIAILLIALVTILSCILFYFFLNREDKQILLYVAPFVTSSLLIIISFIYLMFYRKDKQKLNLYNYLLTKKCIEKQLYILKDLHQETYDGVIFNTYLCEDEEKKSMKVFCSLLVKLEVNKTYNVNMYKHYVMEVKEDERKD